MKYEYPMKLEPDPDGGFIATLRDVPEVITGGADREKSIALAVEALGMLLCDLVGEGEALPASSPALPGEIVIAPAAHDALKIAVLQAFAQSGLSKAEFGRRIDRADMEVRRILNPHHATKIATMEEALAALGKRVVVEVLDAA